MSAAVSSSQPVDRWDVGRRGEPGKGGIGPAVGRGVLRAARGLAKTVLVDAVRGHRSEAPVADDAQRQRRVVDQRRLVHRGRREAREPGALDLDERLDLVAARGANRAVGQLQGLHERTPTWTSRKRAGEAPCETCACWPGWPLPQFVSPHIRHSSGPATASSEAQKAGVAPV